MHLHGSAAFKRQLGMPTAVGECACWQRSRDHMFSPHAGAVRRVRSEERSRTEGDSRGKCSREQQQEAKLTRSGGSGSQAALDRQPKRRRTKRPHLAAAAAAAWAPLPLLLPRMKRTWSTSALKLYGSFIACSKMNIRGGSCVRRERSKAVGPPAPKAVRLVHRLSSGWCRQRLEAQDERQQESASSKCGRPSGRRWTCRTGSIPCTSEPSTPCIVKLHVARVS